MLFRVSRVYETSLSLSLTVYDIQASRLVATEAPSHLLSLTLYLLFAELSPTSPLSLQVVSPMVNKSPPSSCSVPMLSRSVHVSSSPTRVSTPTGKERSRQVGLQPHIPQQCLRPGIPDRLLAITHRRPCHLYQRHHQRLQVWSSSRGSCKEIPGGHKAGQGLSSNYLGRLRCRTYQQDRPCCCKYSLHP